MNEPANFCIFPCLNPEEEARRQGMPPEPPPVRLPPRPLPGYNITIPVGASPDVGSAGEAADGYPPVDPAFDQKEQHILRDVAGSKEDGNLLFPPYRIANGGNARLDLSYRTVDTDVVHYNGLTEYDLHNLYGSSELLLCLAPPFPVSLRAMVLTMVVFTRK